MGRSGKNFGRTESAPGAGDGGGAGEVGGVVEQPEDDGGGVRAEVLEEIHPPATPRPAQHQNFLSSPNPSLAEWENEMRLRVAC